MGQPDGLLTRYYYEASSGNCILIGDYLVAPTNNGIFKILKSEAGNYESGHRSAIINKINDELNGNIIHLNSSSKSKSQ